MDDKKYTEDGGLIVSELSCCPHFEKDRASPKSCSKDCYFCKFSDFRKWHYIESVESEARTGVLYSVCHNENNKKNAI